jgi:hypothetical protein
MTRTGSVIGSMICLSVVPVGCSSSQREDVRREGDQQRSASSLSTEEFVLSWREYDGHEDPEQAMYTWNGKDVGRGRQGFAAVVDRLEHLPPGSKVRVVPRYSQYVAAHPSSGPRTQPYAYSDYEDLCMRARTVRRERHLHIDEEDSGHLAATFALSVDRDDDVVK